MTEEVTVVLHVQPAQPARPWRARLEDTRTRTELVFTSPEALARYLISLEAPRAPPGSLK
jgi:hypothetical protein